MIPSFKMTPNLRRGLGLGLMLPAAIAGAIALPPSMEVSRAQTAKNTNPLSVRSDIQEYNAKNGVFTARGRVQIDYPSRQIQATSAQAQYFSRERRIVLTGNVNVLQKRNSLRGETITYLIDEERFVVQPRSNQQVQSTYFVPEPSETSASSSNP